MINPELLRIAREFNRALAAIDWDRHAAALKYALFHGGNLPPEYLSERDTKENR